MKARPVRHWLLILVDMVAIVMMIMMMMVVVVMSVMVPATRRGLGAAASIHRGRRGRPWTARSHVRWTAVHTGGRHRSDVIHWRTAWRRTWRHWIHAAQYTTDNNNNLWTYTIRGTKIILANRLKYSFYSSGSVSWFKGSIQSSFTRLFPVEDDADT